MTKNISKFATTLKLTSANGAIVVVVVVLLCLGLFVGKAFHIDDPLFVWCAQQIQKDPGDFYGFDVNWYDTPMPMSEVTKNPPGACYYIALVGSIFGFGEAALHIAFLIPAVAVGLGTYYLAKRFCKQPIVAALAGILTPGFLVSSSNVMCDTLMLAFWMWAVVLWVRGTEEDKRPCLFFTAVLISLCALTKYFGMSLLVLLAIYSLVRKRRFGAWVLFLLIPVVILAWYQWVTAELYGRGLLGDAAAFATQRRWVDSVELFSKAAIGLAFTGGCVITALFYGPFLWSRRVLAWSAAAMVLLIAILALTGKVGEFPWRDDSGIRWGIVIQIALLAMAGVGLLAVAVTDFLKSKSADSLLLGLWVGWTFVFATFVNWSVNARSILPMIPAAGILIARQLDRRGKGTGGKINPAVAWPLVAAGIVAISAAWVDYNWANAVRDEVDRIHKDIGNNYQMWFQGHWGFQYYMQAKGHQAYDHKEPKAAAGDLMVIPMNNYSWRWPSENNVSLYEIRQAGRSRWLSIMNRSTGAAFYADEFGPLPFAVGRSMPDKYYVFKFKQ